jgi:hypothetical protein
VSWKVEYTDEFEDWWESDLDDEEQDEIAAVVGTLEVMGPGLPFPYCTGIKGSRHSHMRELRIQIGGHPYRVLYAFDPTRTAILLLGGKKTGNKRWYSENVSKADDLYDIHLQTLKNEGLIK